MLPRLLSTSQYAYLADKGSDAFEPIKYEKRHDICHPFFLYYISRIAVLFNPLENKQLFYEGH
jgi:hypothetical protein